MSSRAKWQVDTSLLGKATTKQAMPLQVKSNLTMLSWRGDLGKEDSGIERLKSVILWNMSKRKNTSRRGVGSGEQAKVCLVESPPGDATVQLEQWHF